MTTTIEIDQSKLNFPIIVSLTITHLGVLFAPFTFSWSLLALTIFLHWLTCGLGITLGYHRLLSHRSFKTPKWVEYILTTLGTLTIQGSPIDWVGFHRLHHKYSDTAQDPHNNEKGFWWSHISWILHQSPSEEKIRKLTGDLNGDPYYEFLHRFFPLFQLASIVFFYLVAGWGGVVWGVFVRLVLTYHSTWLVNSATHKFGYRNFDCQDSSVNCWWVAVLTYGEGWHNNHHAHPHSARHGLKWWELDLTWTAVRVLELLGLASNIRTYKA
ncbi:Acyl-lipid desaturase delta 9 [Hyella patelloides LEGE 07179]|uniref:Acyl-lipid desaturase delta 9 n=1 Tax=Hyella patelloides LEGE 07179 TaxID=945734 RepID=A0A563VSN6_9CYAN|nr:fatty acid desaturase [Hyella patelloides]VEP14445.1 Acyl-lipid desaturase delta 9 [Hyella patelloides LEGE 07179]